MAKIKLLFLILIPVAMALNFPPYLQPDPQPEPEPKPKHNRWHPDGSKRMHCNHGGIGNGGCEAQGLHTYCVRQLTITHTYCSYPFSSLNANYALV